MWQSKRKIQQKKTFKKKYFFSIFLSTVIALFFSYYFFFGKTFLISPLPDVSKTMQVARIDMNQSILQKKLTENGITFSSVTVASDSSYLVTLPAGEQVLFSQKKDIVSQVSSLHLILSRLTIEGKGFSSLDFRFDKPIVVFKN